MLRVGLTGDLGSGKSTVARMLAERGALVFSSDEMARTMMQTGQKVYEEIVERFGGSVLAADNTLDRRKLADLAFATKNPRVEELNQIVHPAVIAAQAKQLAEIEQTNPEAIAVIESALIFSTTHGSSWHNRFDRILLVEAPEAIKIERFIDRIAAGRTLAPDERAALETDARHRLSLQHSEDYASQCVVLHNDGDIEQLEAQVEAVWAELTDIPQSSKLKNS
jgi:dephospho-CoA kinase